MTLSTDEIRSRVAALGDWFHNLDLNGVKTAPNHFLYDYPSNKWSRFRDVVPADLSGRTVLDIGCNAGFYALEMKRRGADRVVAIDTDDRYLEQARLAAEIRGARIEFRNLSVFDVGLLGERFDLVIFMGVLYHLRHPLLALDLIREIVARDLLLFQTMQRGADTIDAVEPDYGFFEAGHFESPGYPKMHFIEQSYSGDPSNWWAPNAACTRAMLRSAGFDIIAHPEAEVYLCRVADRPRPDGALYPARPQPKDTRTP